MNKWVSRGVEAGFSIIEVLIALGIMTVIFAASGTFIEFQTKEVRWLEQKLLSLEFSKLVGASLSDPQVCGYLISNPALSTFDSTQISSTSPLKIPLTTPIYSSVRANPPPATPPFLFGPIVAEVGKEVGSGLIVERVELAMVEAPSPMPPPGPGAVFTGEWQVFYDTTKLLRAIRPVTIPMRFTVDTTNPTAASITACGVANAPTSPVTYIKYKAWSGNHTASPCNDPPACAAGDVELGVGSETKFYYTNLMSQVGVGGNCMRSCNAPSAAGKILYERSCGWKDCQGGSSQSCSPSACATGEIDMGISCRIEGGGPATGCGRVAGTCIRLCLK